MKRLRLGMSALALLVGFGLAACSSSDEPGPGSAPTSAPTPSAVGPGNAEPSATAPTPPSPSGAPQTTSAAQPVPKVGRTGASGQPTSTAKPASVDGTVRYPDGVALRVTSVKFAKETKKGPGSFPGRQFAVLGLELDNGSKRDLSMSTVVVTVLDKDGSPVAPVYADEAKVQDFAGVVKSGRKTKAIYAFAVPKSSRSKVTVVVDFDGVHTSAVFRGKLD